VYALIVFPDMVTVAVSTYDDPAVKPVTFGVVTVDPVMDALPLSFVELTSVPVGFVFSVTVGLVGVPHSEKSKEYAIDSSAPW
jgi:hypothetical protein